MIVSCVLVVLAPAATARAVDPFEIQVYDGTANAPAVIGLELHTNLVVRGTPSENRQAHFTLEPSIGVFRWWELGGYFQTALTSNGSFDYAGVKLRSKFVTPPGWDAHWRLGLNLELSLLPQAFDPDEWGLEIRPIIAWENAHFMFVFNPIVDAALAGPDYRAGPMFEPALSAAYKFGERVSLGFEYYAALGPFSAILPIDQQEHYVYEVVNVLAIHNVEVNIGFGQGLTSASNPFVAKVILGYSFPSLRRGMR